MRLIDMSNETCQRVLHLTTSTIGKSNQTIIVILIITLLKSKYSNLK
jgi:hypothetical protein